MLSGTLHAPTASHGISPGDLKASVKNSDWDFVDADTQYLSHNLHRYSGKFIPQIAARAINLLTNKDELIVDPFCGSGTTLLEAALLDRNAKGFDLSPLAILIAQAKTKPLSQAKINFLRTYFSNVVNKINNARTADLFYDATQDELVEYAKKDEKFGDEWFIKWFGQENLLELLILDHAIRQLEATDLRNVARVALSDILRRCSHAHPGYPNVMFNKNSTERPKPSKIFIPSLSKVCNQLSELNNTDADWSRVSAHLGNAMNMPLPDNSVDAIITHPPYIGSVPYAEYGLLSLMWLGTNPKELDKTLTGGRRQSPDVVERFEHDYCRIIAEAKRVLKPNKYMFIMTGNPTVKGRLVDLEEMTIAFATQCGLTEIITTRRTGSNRRANKMGYESLMFFQKKE